MKIINMIYNNILKLYITFIIIFNLRYVFNISVKSKYMYLLDIINYFYIIGVISILILVFIRFINKKSKKNNCDENFLIVLICISFTLLIIPIPIEHVIYLVIISIITVIPTIIFFKLYCFIYKIIKKIYFIISDKVDNEYVNCILLILFLTLNIIKIVTSKYIR